MSQPTIHLTDVDLLRLLDGECHDREQARLRAHLATCPGCETTQRTIETNIELIDRALALVEPSQPQLILSRVADSLNERRPRIWWKNSPALKIAAVLTLLVSAGVFASPIQTWIARQWELLVSTPEPAPPAVVTDTVVETEDEPGGAAVSFEAESGAFLITIESEQEVGTLTLSRAGTEFGTAMIVGDSESELLILPAGVRIINSSGATSDYRVALPNNITTVSVQIAALPVVNFSLTQLTMDSPIQIELNRLP